MDSLSDLKQYFLDNGVEIKEFNGYQLVIGKDRWSMAHYTLYCNGNPVNRKDKKHLVEYVNKIKEKQNVNSRTQTRNWRGIGGRNLLRDGEHD